MNSVEITAIITGVFTVLAAVIAGYYRLRAARLNARLKKPTSETPEPRPPITVTPPREGPGLKREGPEFRRDAAGSAPGAAGRDSQPPGAPGPTTAPPTAPTRRVLPLVHPDQMYQGLGQPELDAEFITDVQFTLKEGGRFVFDDGSEDPR